MDYINDRYIRMKRITFLEYMIRKYLILKRFLWK